MFAAVCFRSTLLTVPSGPASAELSPAAAVQFRGYEFARYHRSRCSEAPALLRRSLCHLVLAGQGRNGSRPANRWSIIVRQGSRRVREWRTFAHLVKCERISLRRTGRRTASRNELLPPGGCWRLAFESLPPRSTLVRGCRAVRAYCEVRSHLAPGKLDAAIPTAFHPRPRAVDRHSWSIFQIQRPGQGSLVSRGVSVERRTLINQTPRGSGSTP